MPEFLLRGRDHEVVKPGCCLVCQSQKRPLVDLEAVIDPVFWGRLYLCELCGLSVGRSVGCLDPTQAEALRHEASLLREQVAELERELDAEGDRKVVSMDKLRDVVTSTVRELVPAGDLPRGEEASIERMPTIKDGEIDLSGLVPKANRPRVGRRRRK